MIRLISTAALAASALIAVAAPAGAQSRDYYSATFAAAPEDTQFVTRTTVWNCEGATCTAPKAGSRDQIMCELIVREGGALAAFSANGTAFDAAALAKCNSRAE